MGLSVGKATEGTGAARQSHQRFFSPKSLSPELAGGSHSLANSLQTPKTKAKQARLQPFGGPFPEPPSSLLVVLRGPTSHGCALLETGFWASASPW